MGDGKRRAEEALATSMTLITIALLRVCLCTCGCFCKWGFLFVGVQTTKCRDMSGSRGGPLIFGNAHFVYTYVCIPTFASKCSCMTFWLTHHLPHGNPHVYSLKPFEASAGLSLILVRQDDFELEELRQEPKLESAVGRVVRRATLAQLGCFGPAFLDCLGCLLA